MDAETRRAVQALTRELVATQRRLATVERGARRPQLAYSSLEDGQSVEVRDESGQVRQRIGWLPDGTVGMVTDGGDPPPAPTAPTVTPSLGGLRVAWDGTLANDVALPGDFAHVAVHVSTTPGFTPSVATFIGTITQSGDGGAYPVVPLPYVEHYVRLVGVTTSGITGAASAETAATPLQAAETDIGPNSITTGMLQAAAVTADKLAAILVLASRIVAGDPNAARVELNSDGIRAYNAAGELTVAIDSDGSAAFTGTITGSEITGSRMTIGEYLVTPYAAIEEATHLAGAMQVLLVSPSGASGQLLATDNQAEFSAWAQVGDNSRPVGAFAARTADNEVFYQVAATNGQGGPAVSGSAETDRAKFLILSDGSSTVATRMQFEAVPGEVAMLAAAGDATGPSMHLRATTTFASLFGHPEDPATATGDGYPATIDGALYAFRRSGGSPTMALQSPVVDQGPGANMRASLFMDAGSESRGYAQAEVYAREVAVQNDFDQTTGVTSSDPGVLWLTDTHSLLADRHAPQTTIMQAQPTAAGTGDWVDFTEAQFPSLPFETPWSGRVKIVINMCGFNYGSTNATLATGFRLSGASTLAADLKRCAMVRCVMSDVSSRGAAGRTASATIYLQLNGNAAYTLTPAWRTSTTYDWARTDASGGDLSQAYDLLYPNDITVEPMM